MTLEEDFDQYVAQTSPYSMKLPVISSRGARLYAYGGDSYLDLTSGIAVANVGYNHPEVVSAIKDQAMRYAHTNVYGEHTQGPQVEYAKAIVQGYFPEGHQVFFTNSGAEANELSLKMARKLTGRESHAAIVGGFHGRSFGAMSISWNEKYRKGFGTLLPSTFIERNDLEALDVLHTENFASLTLELVQGEAGAYSLTKGFIEAIKKKCDETGTFLIFDEVQTGFGRTGEMFAQLVYGIRPDITVIGKAMGGGLPLGGVVASRGWFEDLQNPPFSHVTTFGGNPICCAAGLAALKVLEREGIVERVRETLSPLLDDLMAQLRDSHTDHIKEVRGMGMLRGLGFHDEFHADAFVKGCFHNGVIVGYKLNNPTTIRLAPPLVISESELKRAFNTMSLVIDSLPLDTFR